MTARSWEVWRQRGFADTYLSRWGDPRLPPETWEKGQRWRTRRATELIVGESVLDVACGCGHLYSYIRENFTDFWGLSEYLGIDNSPEMLAFCREAFPFAHFELGDIYDLKNVGSFDTVFGLSVLLHLPDPWNKPLTNLWEKTKKALVFNTIIDDENPRVEHMDNGLIYNVATESQVLEAAEGLPKVAKVESWVTNADGSEGHELIFVRCLR